MNVWCSTVYEYISVSVSVPFRKYFGVVFSLGLLGCSVASPPVAAVVLKVLPSWVPLTTVKRPSVGVSRYSCQIQCQLLGLMSWVFLLPRLVCSHIWNSCYFCFFFSFFPSGVPPIRTLDLHLIFSTKWVSSQIMFLFFYTWVCLPLHGFICLQSFKAVFTIAFRTYFP